MSFISYALSTHLRATDSIVESAHRYLLTTFPLFFPFFTWFVLFFFITSLALVRRCDSPDERFSCSWVWIKDLHPCFSLLGHLLHSLYRHPRPIRLCETYLCIKFLCLILSGYSIKWESACHTALQFMRTCIPCCSLDLLTDSCVYVFIKTCTNKSSISSVISIPRLHMSASLSKVFVIKSASCMVPFSDSIFECAEFAIYRVTMQRFVADFSRHLFRIHIAKGPWIQNCHYP